jgi:hypothetical protein
MFFCTCESAIGGPQASRTWKAAEHSRHAERKDYAEQALLILQRAAARGYVDPTKTEPVLALIRGLLSNQAG